MARNTKKVTGTRVVVRQRLGRKPPPPNETKRDRFRRIGERRMNAVLSQIALLGNLSSPSYEVTREDVETMRATIMQATEAALARFTPRRTATEKAAFAFENRVTH